ncbi:MULTISPECIES: bifunctional protein-serine/threonine kinase/phosphatase [Bradyrhizobium]|uniref:Serine/threonine protein phosphatase PrpC/predicted Ser/Thr protein kinase n=1 Tax=Bradyrhizobium elkanii TaxID=29448 RepID=A0A8I1YBG4_BRAEL|nr:MULTISPECIES: bifunctional protein-serine/threonine kinase/phosphatase [Bradyrhizobium]MBP1295256.1 serine/threonine protein phosphatase PrpC/predicted Ser/Thr protein kinase [Bradyrhizobium elkanii]MCP1933845.1 serine/threonine protein phosphatase PrpC/predicted Ser/Thr protein kinase [Bradyrhizobium elkanii]MCS3478147.1 serine/threonine protein phosphatase PrpC/predicted Ser/Thr protein kinase [Bradyrhizobium elkanii]MCS3584920.1 serine/threonine protein phosphatase PrpC/predicted Ser/Thr 
MPRALKISVGQFSDQGRKDANQDFHGALIPEEPLLGLKGIAVVLADGISSSSVGRIAAESAVKSFLTDYYCTSESWSVKSSAQRVLEATNSWLHAQTRRSQNPYDKDKGYVCTLSALVVRSNTAHLFHVGDSRIYRVAGNSLEQLTNDHRVVISSQQSYLGRALGVNPQLEIDYQALPLERGDVFLLVTDGIYEHVPARQLAEAIKDGAADLDVAAKSIVEQAYENGSPDNLTVQIVRIDELPDADASEVFGQPAELPLPPLLEARMLFDGYRIVRELHASHRSHIYLAVDEDSATTVAIKIPSIDLRDDPAYLKRFVMEEWVARRIDSPHVLKPFLPQRKRNFLYVTMEYIDGQTLTQWITDNPAPALETVRDITEQIAKGLRAFHRKEMLHQDVRPDNIMIDRTGTVKIIDFGSTRISGVAEAVPAGVEDILGTQQYTAPEYFLGEGGTARSDLFSLGVVTYQMLTGRLPYGAQIARARTRSDFNRLVYRPAAHGGRDVPTWVDGALERAVHANPLKRYESFSEFLFDLRNPNAKYLTTSSTPLIERNPVLFWKSTTLLLALVVVLLLAYGAHHLR